MIFGKGKALKEAEERIQQLEQENAQLKSRYSTLIDADSYLQAVNTKAQEAKSAWEELNAKYRQGLQLHKSLEREIGLYRDDLELGEFGIYQRQFSFDTSVKFKEAIDANYERQKKLIQSGGAVECKTEWSVHGSRAEGKKMEDKFKKLMLFAFNGECDSLIAKVKWNNAEKSKQRIEKAFQLINKLGETNTMSITPGFLKLKLEELALTYEYELKKQEEKEEQRALREQMREEERAQKEFERAQKEAEDEEKRFEKALEKARAEVGSAAELTQEQAERIRILEEQLREAHEKKERALAMAQLTKVGHIYVISNIGAFGEGVYKIGMTRRLDPLDRVKELGDASVPFQFDVHAIIYSENAPQLEAELHQTFARHRVNLVNNRKEFFRVELSKIEEFIKSKGNAEIEFTAIAEAQEFRESMNVLARAPGAAVPVERYPDSLS